MYVYTPAVEAAATTVFMVWLRASTKCFPAGLCLHLRAERRNLKHLLLWLNHVTQIYAIRITNLFRDCVSAEAEQ